MQKKKLLDVVRDKIRFKHYSISTERIYLYWLKYFILFHDKKHPIEMGKAWIEDFLTYLAVEKKLLPPITQISLVDIFQFYFYFKISPFSVKSIQIQTKVKNAKFR